MIKTNQGTQQVEQNINSIVSTLESFVKTEVSNLEERAKNEIVKENAWRKTADDKINQKLGKETDLRIEQVNTEKKRAQEQEQLLQDKINTEIERATQKENQLQDRSKQIATWVNDGQSADDLNGGLLYKEQERAISAESKITRNLNTEITRATTVENEIKAELQKEIQSRIDLDDSYIKKNEANQSISGGLTVDGLSSTSLETDNATIDSLSVIDNTKLNTVEISNSLSVNKDDTANFITLSNGNISTKDLTVRGTLTTLGGSVSEIHETIKVKNNIIVLREGATTAPTTSSGLVINIDKTNAYGITYEPSTDSVNLSYGQLSSDGTEFIVDKTQSNPIIIRDDSDSITNGNIIKWIKEQKTEHGKTVVSVKAVDSGLNADSVSSVMQDATKLREDLTTETATREKEISTLRGNLLTEIDRATKQENALLQQINDVNNSVVDEATARKSADDKLSARLSTVESNLTEQTAKLTTEVSERKDADAQVLQQANNYTDEEKDRATKAESDLSSKFTTLNSQVSILKENVETNQESVSKQINTLTTEVSNEVQARKDADSTIRTEIDDAIKSVNDQYGSVKEFYDSFVQAKTSYPDKLLACYWNSTTNKPVWTVLDNGEL